MGRRRDVDGTRETREGGRGRVRETREGPGGTGVETSAHKVARARSRFATVVERAVGAATVR